MANLFKNILDSLKLTDDDDMDDYDDYVSELEEKERKKVEKQEQRQASRQEKKTYSGSRTFATEEAATTSSSSRLSVATGTTDFADLRKERAQRPEKSNVSKVVPIRNAQKGLEVCIMKPTSFEDSQDICDMLLSGRAAVINLEGFDVDIAQRVMDFISGAVYALNGKLHQISSYIFIISPDSVDISGDYLDLIRQNGFEVPTLNKDF